MLLHAPVPLGAVLAMFVILGLLSSRSARSRWSTVLVWAWVVVGLASVTIWLLWWRWDNPELPEPAYLALVGNSTTGITAVVLACTVWHLGVRSRRRPGPSPRS